MFYFHYTFSLGNCMFLRVFRAVDIYYLVLLGLSLSIIVIITDHHFNCTRLGSEVQK